MSLRGYDHLDEKTRLQKLISNLYELSQHDLTSMIFPKNATYTNDPYVESLKGMRGVIHNNERNIDNQLPLVSHYIWMIQKNPHRL